MQTLHLSNQPLNLNSPIIKLMMWMLVIVLLFLFIFSPGWQQSLLTTITVLSVLGFGYLMIKKATVCYTLTPFHFQQHLFKGGWVVKWSNISEIGIWVSIEDRVNLVYVHEK